MIIKTNSHDVNVASAITATIRKGGKSYPAIKFVFDGAISAEDIAALTSGSFSIGEDVHEGYNTQGEISITVGKITTAEQRIAELEAEMAAMQAEKEELQAAVNVMVGGSEE